MFSIIRDLLGITEIIEKLDCIIRKDRDMGTNLDGIRTDVKALREGQAAQTSALQDLSTRLGDNPTAEEIAAIKSELDDAIVAQGANTDTINSLDPDRPGGSVTPPADGDPPDA